MAHVYVFDNNGVIRIVENSSVAAEQQNEGRQGGRRKVLEHLPSGEVVSSYTTLEQILTGLGWERYSGGDPNLFQFHKQFCKDLISLPKDFSRFYSVHMYDIVIKNPQVFRVRDI